MFLEAFLAYFQFWIQTEHTTTRLLYLAVRLLKRKSDKNQFIVNAKKQVNTEVTEVK